MKFVEVCTDGISSLETFCYSDRALRILKIEFFKILNRGSFLASTRFETVLKDSIRI